MDDITITIGYSGNSDCKSQVTCLFLFSGKKQTNKKPQTVTKQNHYNNLAKDFIKYYWSLWDVRITSGRSADEFFTIFWAELFKEKLPSSTDFMNDTLGCSYNVKTSTNN